MVGDASKATEYENIANEWRMMINEVLWDDELGAWFDYDIVQGELRKEFYATNIVPLWAGAQTSSSTVHRLLKYLRTVKVLKFPGGVPTSTEQSGEQWDYPNGWPPLQHLLVEALEQSGDMEAKELAFELAERWIESNYIAFYQSQPHHMFEKYDVTVKGLSGGGGEYDVVVGFGWTNGVILDFLNRYGDKLFSKTHRPEITGAATAMSPVLTTSVTLGGIIILLASIYGIAEIGRRLRSAHNNNCDGRHPSSRTLFPDYLYGALVSPQRQTEIMIRNSNNDKALPEGTQQRRPDFHK
jgi:alpha,alpha-trehalase